MLGFLYSDLLLLLIRVLCGVDVVLVFLLLKSAAKNPKNDEHARSA